MLLQYVSDHCCVSVFLLLEIHVLSRRVCVADMGPAPFFIKYTFCILMYFKYIFLYFNLKSKGLYFKYVYKYLRISNTF